MSHKKLYKEGKITKEEFEKLDKLKKENPLLYHTVERKYHKRPSKTSKPEFRTAKDGHVFPLHGHLFGSDRLGSHDTDIEGNKVRERKEHSDE